MTAKDVEVFSVLGYDTGLGVRQQKGFLMWTEWIKLSEFPQSAGADLALVKAKLQSA